MTDEVTLTIGGWLAAVLAALVSGIAFGRSRRVRKVQITLDLDKSSFPPKGEKTKDG